MGALLETALAVGMVFAPEMAIVLRIVKCAKEDPDEKKEQIKKGLEILKMGMELGKKVYEQHEQKEAEKAKTEARSFQSDWLKKIYVAVGEREDLLAWMYMTASNYIDAIPSGSGEPVLDKVRGMWERNDLMLDEEKYSLHHETSYQASLVLLYEMLKQYTKRFVTLKFEGPSSIEISKIRFTTWV